MKLTFSIIILCLLKQVFGCQSGGYYGGHSGSSGTGKDPVGVGDRYSHIGNHSNGSGTDLNTMVTHLEIPSEIKAEYEKWLANYLKNKQNSSRYSKIVPGDLPADFQGYGAGDKGEEPPPWAYVAPFKGRPDYCFLSPIRGRCPLTILRYAYNSFTGACDSFIWGGCGGNLNRFASIKECLATCRDPIQSNCLGFDSFEEE